MSKIFDHRQLAEEMDIFFIDPQIGAGLPVWLPNGVAIRDALEDFVKELERRAGYQRVVSPHVAKESLYARSGHLDHYRNEMFPEMSWPAGGAHQSEKYFLRPMNCPHHHRIFSNAPRSFRQLPLRIAEYGQVYRFEPSGSLRGLGRVRGLCQNDAHIYVDPAHAFEELLAVMQLHERCYKALGLGSYRYRLSKHDPSRPGDFPGDPAKWAACEMLLRRALEEQRLPFFESVGEAAFYGPKIDIQMKLGGNEESISSVQLDFISGERFELGFVAASGEKQVPWIIHRAPLGSHERFVAMLLEEFQGRLPAWLAPLQVAIVPVSDGDAESARKIFEQLHHQGLRVQCFDGPGHLSKRVKQSHRARPFAKILIGEKDHREGVVRVELRDEVLRVEISELPKVLRELVASPLRQSS